MCTSDTVDFLFWITNVSKHKILQVEIIEPAVKGTANVLEACLEAKVERVVFVSSEAAITMNPSLPHDKVIDESYWSDKEYCRKTQVCKIDFICAYDMGFSLVLSLKVALFFIGHILLFKICSCKRCLVLIIKTVSYIPKLMFHI